MPTYEYRCPAGHEFERFEKINRAGRARCPTCGRLAARQISGGAGLVFKGSGFYITDYARAAKPPRAESADGAGGRAESAAQEGKPAAAKGRSGEKQDGE
jgi:putative FmdB family regulatory protein